MAWTEIAIIGGVAAAAISAACAAFIAARNQRQRVSLYVKSTGPAGTRISRLSNLDAADPRAEAELRAALRSLAQTRAGARFLEPQPYSSAYGAPWWILPLIAGPEAAPTVFEQFGAPFRDTDPHGRDGSRFSAPTEDPPSTPVDAGAPEEHDFTFHVEKLTSARATLARQAQHAGRGAVLLAEDARGRLVDLRYPASPRLVRACTQVERANQRALRNLSRIDPADQTAAADVRREFEAYCEAVNAADLEIEAVVVEVEATTGRTISVNVDEYILLELLACKELARLKHEKTTTLAALDKADRFKRMEDFRNAVRAETEKAGVAEVAGEALCLLRGGLLLRTLAAVYKIDGDRSEA